VKRWNTLLVPTAHAQLTDRYTQHAGTTLDLVGLKRTDEDTNGWKYIPKEKLQGDIQFRGAISDFYAIKQKIADADYDPLLIRPNEDDVYGDGNNYEVSMQQSTVPTPGACLQQHPTLRPEDYGRVCDLVSLSTQIALCKEAAGIWEFIEEELERRRQAAEEVVARRAAEKLVPRSQRKREAKPWISRGSEVAARAGCSLFRGTVHGAVHSCKGPAVLSRINCDESVPSINSQLAVCRLVRSEMHPCDVPMKIGRPRSNKGREAMYTAWLYSSETSMQPHDGPHFVSQDVAEHSRDMYSWSDLLPVPLNHSHGARKQGVGTVRVRPD
jgi:hypothetical protein